MCIFYIIVLISLASCASSQFTPGCSFFNGQCVYNIQMGQEQQCDSVGSATTGASQSVTTSTDSLTQLDTGSGCSCKDVSRIQTDISTFRSTITELQNMIDTMSNQMNITKGNLHTTNALLTAEQQKTAALLATLTSKEKMLNESKEELANVLALAKTELDGLRQQLILSSRNLSTCQGAMNIPLTQVSGENIIFLLYFRQC